jgi:petrobactin synthase
MTRDAILEAMRRVLADTMAHPQMEFFAPAARLNEDLYLDSVLMMNLFLNLEREHGLAVPEEAITRQPPVTVDDVVDLFDPEVAMFRADVQFVDAVGSVHDDTMVDIKVHCVVSCLCEGLRHDPALDQRPFYFTVWDAGFAVDARMRLRYHSDEIDHGVFRRWYERLYGIRVRSWHDVRQTQAKNIATMLAGLDDRKPGEVLTVMLDMFHLPERENKFNQNPFPHYLILEPSDDPGAFRVRDVDYRWEGDIARDKVLHAIDQPAAAGGFILDPAEGRPPHASDIHACFVASFEPGRNLLIDALREIVAAHLDGRDGLSPAGLEAALAELPILTMRKYAYEHGFAYFWRALVLPDAEFQAWCDEIEVLVSGLKLLHVDVLRLAKTGDRTLAPAILARLAHLDRQEARIKRRLADVHALWAGENGLDIAAPLSGAA